MKCDMYLAFDGNCEEAMKYYRDILDGEFTVTMRYADGPPEYSNPQIENKIMHQTLIFGNGCELKASDNFNEPLLKGNNYHVSISTEDEEEGHAIFKGLSEGGTITMPYDNVFWGGKFGSCIDQFGIQWMISVEPTNS